MTERSVKSPLRMSEITGAIMRAKGKTLAVAESCTGGLISHMITQVPGSSDYFLGGVVAYSNAAKVKLLKVRASTIKQHGAVSPETAAEMAAGVRRIFGADIGVSTTGIAGPGGGSRAKPVGLVHTCVFGGRRRISRRFLLKGTRDRIKRAAARAALSMLLAFIGAEGAER